MASRKIARKKSAKKKKSVRKKPSAARAAKTTKKKLAAKKKTAKKKAGKKKASRKTTGPKRKVARRKAVAVKKKRIFKNSDNFQLHLLFKTDKPCRDCFEFLRVSTLEELQQFTPRQIVDFLSVPFMQSVERMRTRLAEVGTCLAGDESFLVRYRQQHKQK